MPSLAVTLPSSRKWTWWASALLHASWQPENAIPIKPFFGDRGDTGLLDLIPFLKNIVNNNLIDVRSVLKKCHLKVRVILCLPKTYLSELLWCCSAIDHCNCFESPSWTTPVPPYHWLMAPALPLTYGPCLRITSLIYSSAALLQSFWPLFRIRSIFSGSQWWSARVGQVCAHTRVSLQGCFVHDSSNKWGKASLLPVKDRRVSDIGAGLPDCEADRTVRLAWSFLPFCVPCILACKPSLRSWDRMYSQCICAAAARRWSTHSEFQRRRSSTRWFMSHVGRRIQRKRLWKLVQSHHRVWRGGYLLRVMCLNHILVLLYVHTIALCTNDHLETRGHAG